VKGRAKPILTLGAARTTVGHSKPDATGNASAPAPSNKVRLFILLPPEPDKRSANDLLL
jgi:hypothetical protein